MTAPHLSPTQIRNRMILSARMIAREHTPGPNGRCPVCRVAGCQARVDALAYLAAVDGPAR